MASEDLKKSWQRTETYLRDARAHFSNAAEGACSNELHDFQDYLDHNELGLALDCLDEAFERSGVEDLRVFENMALASSKYEPPRPSTGLRRTFVRCARAKIRNRLAKLTPNKSLDASGIRSGVVRKTWMLI